MAATFYFSNSQFESSNKGGKKKFKSSEYIYGRVDLPQTVKEFFDTDNSDSRDYSKGALMMDVQILNPEGTQLGSIRGKFIKPTADQLGSKYLNFDISPEPSQATTLMAMVSTFDLGFSSVPSARLFDQSGYYGRVPNLVDGTTYTVEVILSRWTFDPFNPIVPLASEKWNRCVGKFELAYNSKDIPMLIKNNKAADELVKDNASKKAMANRGLPKEWNTWNGPNATGHTDQQLIDMYLRGKPAGSKVFKVVIGPKPGGPLWDIRRDNGVSINERHCMQLVGVFAQAEGKCTFGIMGVRETYLGDRYDVENAWMQTIDRVDVDPKFIPTSAAPKENKASKGKKEAKPVKVKKVEKKKPAAKAKKK